MEQEKQEGRSDHASGSAGMARLQACSGVDQLGPLLARLTRGPIPCALGTVKASKTV